MGKVKGLLFDGYNKYKEIINYVIIGGLTTLVSLFIYYISVLTVLNPNNEIELQIANVISWIGSVTFAYFTNRSFVFQSKNDNKLKEMGSFFSARVLTLLIDMLIMYIFVSKLEFNDKIIKLSVQVVVIILNYILSKLFVFRNK